jgi:hypothetical protein
MSTPTQGIQLPNVQLASSQMFTTTINVPQDVITAGQVQAAMYGQLLQAYTPTNGPSKGQVLAAGQWVYFTDSKNGSDYAAASGTVPAFDTWTTAGPQTVKLPAVQIAAAHIVFGIGTLPSIPVVNGAPQQPVPGSTPGIYDFVEFTYNTSNVLFVNTTAIDQFGIPIQIQVTPASVGLPAGAGVTAARADVFTAFTQYVQAHPEYAQCAQDMFGNAITTRIMAPADVLTSNCVQGVTANAFTDDSSTLAAQTYYYGVSAVDASGKESYVQPKVVQATPAAKQAVQVAWAQNSAQPAGIVSYNVYRGTMDNGTLTWGLLKNVAAADFGSGVGGAFADTGQALGSAQPKMNPLATAFDVAIKVFFATHATDDTGATKPLVLTATDGTPDGYVYTFSGTTVPPSATASGYLGFTLTKVALNGTDVTSPPIPLQTAFNLYYPFWNTNTFDPTAPPPPSWALYATTPASMMVLAAQGVFADNGQQVPPTGFSATQAEIWSTLLGSLENQVVAALTRGIATSPSVVPQNWGNGTAPVQVAPTLSTQPGTLTAGTTYYYVVTATNSLGETIASLEFNATPTADAPSVQVNWLPVSTAAASSCNVYRGTASQQEDAYWAVTNDGTTASWVDTGGEGSPETPPTYYPSNGVWDAYAAFLHQPSISLNGAAYASPYDDQGGQSSTLATASPTALSITLGPWASAS